MKKIEFRCRLLSDLVLTSSAASESHSPSLDYIPGSKFLGIVSKELYDMNDEQSTLDIFHSGKIRFGDAHPLVNNERYFPSPATYFFNKGESIADKVFLHHNLDNTSQKKLRKEDVQLKQLRTGYIHPDSKSQLQIKQNYRLKSAYDSKTRRSKDGQMFGYFSLPSLSEWTFTVEDETGNYLETIKKGLEGKKRIGRSKSAEYGLVKITFVREVSQDQQRTLAGRTILFAQSNLCFINKYGDSTAQPEVGQLGGLGDSKILWAESQVRSRRYQSWNGKRNKRDADKVIIEKGSVFVLDIKEPISSSFFEKGIGAFTSEGFGKVLVNPDFLPLEGAELAYSYSKSKDNDHQLGLYVDQPDDSKSRVMQALIERRNMGSFDQTIKAEVRDFIAFQKQSFRAVTKSQWGTLQAYAKQSLTLDAFDKLVFGIPDVKGLEGFLYKGASQNQWKDGLKTLQAKIQGLGKAKGEKYALAFIQKLTVEIPKKNNHES